MVVWRRVGRLAWLIVFSVLTLSVAWAEDQPVKLAVLPLVIHGQQDALNAQKSLDQVFAKLITGEGIKLIGAQEAMKAAGGPVRTEDQARSVGSRLGADYVLFGSFNQVGNSISLDTKLVDISGKKKPVVLFAEEKGMENLPSAAGKIVQQMSIHVLSKAIIADIKITGNDRIEADAVKGVIKSKKGELLKADQVGEDIRAIYKMGYFEKVSADVSDSPAGKVLTFTVQENPTVQEVKVSGEKKIKEKDVMAAIATKPYTVLQRSLVSEDVQKILKLYQQKGYFNAHVNSKIEFPKDPRKAVVSFKIDENKKVWIRSIRFTGNKHLSSRKLRGVMQTKVKTFVLSWFTDRGILQKDILETDIDRLTAYYHDEGYMDAKVSSPETDLKSDGFHIKITIDEGPRYTVSSVGLKGDLLDDYETKIMKKLQLTPKSYFSREKIRKDIDTVTKAYMMEGYARVEVDPQIRRNVTEHTTSIEFLVSKREVIHIGKIFITGNSKTRDYVIRRELTIAEGDRFDSDKIEKSLTRLKKLDYFEDVQIAPLDTENREIMNLQVKVKEKMTGTISLGGGYSSDDGMFVSGQVQQKNLFGKGQQVSLRGYLGQSAQRYMLSFTEPWIFGRPISAGIDLYNWIRDYEDFTKDAYGFRLRAGFPFGQYSRFTAYYMFEKAKITDLDTALQALVDDGTIILDDGIKSAVGVGFERDTTDHPFLPTKGMYTGVAAELTSRLMGSDFDFMKHEYHAGYYHPLFWKFIGHIRGEVGFLHELRGDGNVPIYEKYFLGGINSLRGFQFGQVGPKEEGVVVGGDKYAVTNFELLFPIMEKYGIRGVVFFDAGNAFAKGEAIDISKFRTDVGTGVRWNSPFGPLRIEIGYNLDRESGDSPYQWQFSAGAFF